MAKTAANKATAKSTKSMKKNKAEKITKNEEAKKTYKCLEKRSTARDEETKHALTSRLNRAAGQISGLQGMLENDAYCTDILVQVAAVQAALRAFSRELIVEHLENVVTRDLKKGETESMNEFVKVLQKQFMNG